MLKAARKGSGLTQAQLASRGGTSQATLSAYESGAKDPSASTFLRLLAAAGTRVEPKPAPVVVALPRRTAAERARILEQVLDLAAALPGRRRSAELDYPPIGRLYGSKKGVDG